MTVLATVDLGPSAVIIRRAEAADVPAIVDLTSDKSRRGAHRFYERLGFVASHEGMKLAL